MAKPLSATPQSSSFDPPFLCKRILTPNDPPVRSKLFPEKTGRGGGREGGQAQEHHVALLAKFVGGGEVVEVALKSDLPGLARALAGEAEALCTF